MDLPAHASRSILVDLKRMFLLDGVMTMPSRHIWLLFVLILGGLISGGCRKQDADLTNRPPCPYAAVDSLLGAMYRVPGTDLQVRPPAGFNPAADSILMMLQARLEQGIGPDAGVQMVACFLDTIHMAGLMISVIEESAVRPDTGIFWGRYRQSLYKLFSQERVREENFWSGDVEIKTFLAKDENPARWQCVCMGPSGDPVELTYFVNQNSVPALMEKLKASTASIGPAMR